MHLSKPIECTSPRVNYSVNYELWVIMMCQCRFINCNKCVILLGNVNSGEAMRVWGTGGIWYMSVPFP